MLKKKPCRVCGRWFLPNRRASNRQRVCSNSECQRERHRRNCADWHRKNPDYDREDRLRHRLAREEEGNEPASAGGLFRKIDESAARDLVGLEVFVFADEIGKHLIEWVRDSVGLQHLVITSKSGKQPPVGTRDDMAKTRPPT